MDIIQTEIDECYKSAAAMIMFNILAEKAQLTKLSGDVDLDNPGQQQPLSNGE
jgi:hypothetical protein